MQTTSGNTLSDAHADELRLAMEAAAAWRAKFHKPKASALKDTASQTPTATESKLLCSSTCASSGNSDLDSSEAATPDIASVSPAVPHERSAAKTWAFVILLSEISHYLAEGLRAPLRLKNAGRHPRIRLYTGPWGRTGLCKHAGSVLVLVDAAAALNAGARVTRGKDSMVLSPGSVIPSSAFRKMIHITNGATLYERSTDCSPDDELEIDSESEDLKSEDEPLRGRVFAGAHSLPLARKVRSLRPVEGTAASLAAWLRAL